MLDADDVSVDKNLGVFSHLESGLSSFLFFSSLFSCRDFVSTLNSVLVKGGRSIVKDEYHLHR